MYTFPVTLLNKIHTHGLSDKISLHGKEADSHFSEAHEIMQSTGVTLPSEHIVVVMTPYKKNQDDLEPHFYFEIIAVEEDCEYFENSMYYGEEKFNWLSDSISKVTFSVAGQDNAQPIFGFLASQFFY